MFTPYRSLSENSQRLLCAYAYAIMGAQKSMREIKNILHSALPDFSSSSTAPEDELVEKHIMERKGFNWHTSQHNFVITEQNFVPALWYTLEERKDLVELFQRLNITPGVQYTFIRQAVYQLVNSGYTTCSNAMYIKAEDVRFLAPVCISKYFKPLFDCLQKDTFELFFIRTVSNLIENDIVIDEDYLHKLLSGNKALPLPTTVKLTGYMELYAYLAHGTIPKHDTKTSDFAGLTLAAIHRVLHGNYTEAVKIFQMALKIHNKTSDMKNMYLVSLLNYYLIISYVREGSADAKTRLKQFLNKSNTSDYYKFIPSRIIAEQALQTGKELHKDNIRTLLMRQSQNAIPKTIGHLAFLLNRYYEFNAKPDGYQHVPPRMAILRHELSSYIDISESDRQHLTELYGDKPGLASERHKADWELSLERLLNIGNTTQTEQTECTSRLMYVMHSFRGSIEVREQTRLKNGGWGSGKAVNLTRFVTNEIECMTDADRRILNRFRSSDSYSLDLEHIIEEMTEESRLYYGNYAPFELVKVTEDKPYLIIEKDHDRFLVRSNVPKIGINDEIVINHNSDTHITFVKIPEEQRFIYRELLSTGSYPLQAEATLRRALAHIGGTVEIHSELIEGGSTIPTIDGTGLACVQISPSTDGFYTLTISAHPLPDGKGYFSLGKGDELYIDEHDGQRTWVRRDMDTEKRVADLFRTFFNEQGENADVDFHDPEVMLDAESRLDLDPIEMITILDFIQSHPEDMYAEWPEGKKAKIRTLQKGASSWSATLHERGMWFQLEGELQIDDNTVLTMSQLLDLASMNKGKYIKLGENEFLALNEKLQRQLRALEAVANREKGEIHISPFSAALLGEDAINGDIRIFMSNNLLELRKRIMDSEKYMPEIPKELRATLRPYQIDGYQWIARLNSWGAGALLADDMGLGKTVQTIAFLLLKAQEGASLVVAPASVAPNWKVELEKFAPSLNTIILNFATDRRKAIRDAGPNDIIITTYGILLSEQDTINARKWNVACLDEAHIIKNRGAKTSAAAMKIQADNRVILTGTPVQNHLSELWSLFQFINPGLLGGYEMFSRKFITPIERDGNKACQERLDKVVHPFMLRRTKNAVLQELPDKTEIYQNIELSKEEMAVYEVIRNKAEKLLESQLHEDKLDFNVLAEITRLRQASCSARLIEHNWNGENSKVTALIELLQGVIEGNNRALVFSQFTSFFDIVREALEDKGIDYLYIDGSIPVKKRTELVDSFQRGECPVFLISLKAGGLGLNLTNANYVVHLDPWWNPAIEQQATDRAYRIGQKQAVTVYHLISQNTIEEKIIRLHQTKRELAENILDGTDISHRLTGKDLMEMVAK